jgi:glycosyltransferase involved in cell wall biosynthesis
MTDLRLYLHPQPSQCTPETGIGRVVLAQNNYLPAYGVQLVTDPARADLIACHVNRPDSLARVDVLHIHGLNWTDTPHVPYRGYHHAVNRGIIRGMQEAYAVTVPSDWVAVPLRRDMRINPRVVGHGIDFDEWQPITRPDNLHYVLWAKNRPMDVCDPTPAYEMARRGAEVISTFAPIGKENGLPPTLRVTGLLPAAQMRTAVACADAYLATTMETFGIGTVEALACGVPVLGYDWGGTAEIVRHGVDGFLVEPGDVDGLMEGLDFIRRHRADLSENARRRALDFTWDCAMQQYATLYREVWAEKQRESAGVAVVVPNHNYAKYLPGCVASLQAQTQPPEEIIIVDDCSTDDSRAVIAGLAESDRRIKVILHEQNMGVAAARNNGIASTRQPFIVCLDADDELAPDYLAVCARAMTGDRSLGVAYTGLMLWGDGGTPTPSQWPPEFDWEAMTKVTVPPSNCIPSAAMFRRAMWERAGGYKQVYAPAEDTEFWVRGLSVGFNARRVSSAGLFIYRVHPGSASRTRKYHAIDQWHPWMRDKAYPLGAPQVKKPAVRSYALPVVSVIIPVGPGHAQYLPGALDSLLGQSVRDWEVIVVNDSGGELPEDVTRVYPFIRQHVTGGGLGAGAARNIGLDMARAPLCLFLDADDYLDPQALEKMLALYGESEGRYIYSDWISFTGWAEAAKTIDGKAQQTAEYDPRRWLERVVSGGAGGAMNAVTVLMATAQARRLRFDEALPGWEDADFFARCAVAGVHGRRLPEPLLYYRTYSGGRREAAKAEREQLTKLFAGRYGPYWKGEQDMAGCCGGSAGSALMAAKRMVSGGPLPDDEPIPSGVTEVRMRFTGDMVGASTYIVNGRAYRGGNNDSHRFVNARPGDVVQLERMGCWKRVETIAAEAAATDITPLPPSKTAAELRAEAEAALLRAKQGADALVSEPAPEPVDEAPAVETPKKKGGKKAAK